MRALARALVALPAGALVLGLVAPTATAAPGAQPGPAVSAAQNPSAPRVRPQRDVTRLIVRTSDGGSPGAAALSAAGTFVGAPRASVVRRLSRSRTLVSLGRAVPVAEAWAAARALAARPDVLSAEPDLWVYPTADTPALPTDPEFAHQWDLWDTSSSVRPGGYATRAPGAWSRTTGVPSVVVAVIDTGITSHPDISAGSLVPGYDFVADVPTANDGDGRDPDPSDPGDWVTPAESVQAGGPFDGCLAEPSSWHGTHVTGTIVATPDNGIGIAGTAPGVRVQPVRALGKCGGWASDIDDAITWASGGTVPGVPANPTPATVINMSLGGAGRCLASTQDAITGARNRGTTIVVATGNDGVSFNGSGSQPADCAGVIAVEASTRSGRLASYSNFGTVAGTVGIAAPGGSGTTGEAIFSTINTGSTGPAAPGYGPYSGTSMATPHVAAAAALLQSRVTVRLTPDQVRARLQSTAVPWPAAARCTPVRCGPGILDIAAALPDPPGAPVAVERAGSHGMVTLTWEAPAPDGLPVLGYHLVGSADGGATWKDVVPLVPAAPTYAFITQFADGTPIVDDQPYSFRVSAVNAVAEGPATETAPVTPTLVSAPLMPGPPTVTGGVERVNASWSPPADGGAAITEQGVRYRRTGSTTWSCVVGAAPSCSTGEVARRALTASTWPVPMPAGTYEVQTRAGNALGAGLWGPSGTAVVRALVESVTSSAPVVRPFRDGFQDSTLLRVRTNRPGGSYGTLRVVSSTGRVVFATRLATASAWKVVWRGTTTKGVALPAGRYTVQVSLRGRTASFTLHSGPRVTLATSQAARPVVTLSSPTVFPVRDGYHDTVRITTTAVVPARMTWKLLRAGRTWWTATWSPRITATALYGGARTGGGTVPAGTYTLAVYAVGGQGRTTVTTRTLVVSPRRAVRTPFATTVTAAAVAEAGTPLGEGGQPTVDDDAGTASLPQLSRATFLATLPATALGYSSVRVRVLSTSASGTPSPRGGYYTGSPTSPSLLPLSRLSPGSALLPVAPARAVVGRTLRWYLQNSAPTPSEWRIRSFTLTGYRWVLS